MKLLDLFKKKKENKSTFPENELERYLMEASSNVDAQKYFYQKLIWNQLIVLTPDYLEVAEGEQIVEENSKLKLVSFEGGKIPVFTSLNRIFDQEIIKEKVSYISLKGQDLFAMTKGASFILNPYSPYGKDLVPEEIEQLMNGTIYDRIDADEAERIRTEKFSNLYNLACDKQEGLILLGGYRMEVLDPADQKKLEESVDYFQQCLLLIEDHWPSMVLMAKALQRLGRHEEALVLLEQAFAINQENHSIPMEAALEAVHLRDLEKALYYSAASMKRKPDDFALMGNHAMNLVLAERDHEALALIEEALVLEPQDEVNENVKSLILEVMAGDRARPTIEETIGS
ncbi:MULTISPECIES: SseB family protein [unclassified Myroides]|uniref:SseB family protein n=1 Tax=unclassified Myroides TaxID=2642485 RepID=UPI0015FA8C73|nr:MULTISPECIES: SseB family protein [unclassified Myroides]MBB1150062.1 SseB family protein [Myroides sp. NP-2]MDM1407259.1 SseB family protein [Myroides sp. DF42-4-2]